MSEPLKTYGEGDIVAVMLGVAVEGPYSYRVGVGIKVARGSIVMVPLGPRQTMGVVWGEPKDKVAHNRLKDILLNFDVPRLSEELLQLVNWVARYTLARPGMVLRAVLRSREALDPARSIIGYQVSGHEPERMTPARARVLEVMEQQSDGAADFPGGLASGLASGFAWTKTALVGESGVSPSVIEGLVKAGTLRRVELPPPQLVGVPDPDFAPPVLNKNQQQAVKKLETAFEGGNQWHCLTG